MAHRKILSSLAELHEARKYLLRAGDHVKYVDTRWAKLSRSLFDEADFLLTLLASDLVKQGVEEE